MNPTSYVDAVRYESRSYGISAPSYNFTTVFVPSRQLQFSSDGSVYRTDKGVQSLAADKIMDSPLHAEKDWATLEKLMAEADEKAKEKIQIPVEVVDQLEAQIEEQNELETKLQLSKDKTKNFILNSGLFLSTKK